MSAADRILTSLRRAGASLTANADGTLSFGGCDLTPEIRAQIVANKPALRWILAWERITRWRDAGLSIEAAGGKLSVQCCGGWFPALHAQCVADLAGHGDIIMAVLVAELRPAGAMPRPPRPPKPPPQARPRPPRPDRPIEVAVPWLRKLLAAGPLPSQTVRRLGAEVRISWRTLQRAQLYARVESVKREFGGPCEWQLSNDR